MMKIMDDLFRARMEEREKCAIELEFLGKCVADGIARSQLMLGASSLRDKLEFKAYLQMKELEEL